MNRRFDIGRRVGGVSIGKVLRRFVVRVCGRCLIWCFLGDLVLDSFVVFFYFFFVKSFFGFCGSLFWEMFFLGNFLGDGD